MGLVHIGLDLEDEARELLPAGVHRLAGQAVQAGQRGGGQAEELLQEGFDAEVGEGRSKEHRAQLPFQHPFQVEFLGGAVQKLDLVHQLPVQVGGQTLVQAGVAQLQGDLVHLAYAVGAAVSFKGQDPAAHPVEHALEVLAAADGPVHGIGLDAQDLLDVLHQLKGVPGLPVHLVDESEDRDMPQGAHLEQLDGLGLHALGGVDHHDGRVGGHQGAVGILRKVLVAGGVQDVDALACIVELQHRGGHRDAALLFNVHPVRDGMAGALLALDRAGLVDGSPVQQQFFGEGGFARVGVADDGERAAAFDFFTICHSTSVFLSGKE